MVYLSAITLHDKAVPPQKKQQNNKKTKNRIIGLLDETINSQRVYFKYVLFCNNRLLTLL